MTKKEIEKYNVRAVSEFIWHSRKIGTSWDDIQRMVKSDHGVFLEDTELMGLYRTFRARLAEMSSPEDRAMELTMELERLNALQEAWWVEAMNDGKAATLVLNIMKERNRILGLGNGDITDPNVTQNVLIINDNKDEWIEALTHGRDGAVVLPGPVEDDGGVDNNSQEA